MSEIAKQIESLNSEQKEVALCDDHCLAIAAPGSGKTKTLSVKAARLLARGQSVVAVTFTRDAALELRDRIIQLAGQDALPRLLVGTFHSIDLLMAFPAKAKSGMGAQILSAGFSRLTRQWEIIKESNRRSAVMRAVADAELAIECDEASGIIEAIKAGYAKPENDQQETLVKSYSEMLRRHGVIDFQDILLQANRGIKEGLISPLRADHLMIDEFQDTDAIQFEWAMLHAKAGVTLTAVGDDDQSIYGFRRALGYKGMVDFHEGLRATRIVLGMNYRSHGEILKPAAALIAQNQDRMEKDLVAFKGPGGDVLWNRFGTRQDEASMCHEWVRKALQEGKSVGVLARTNKRLDNVEAMCLSAQTPYYRAEGGSILQTREMAVFVAAMGLLVRNKKQDADEVLAWLKLTEDELKALSRAMGNDGLKLLEKTKLQNLPLSTQSRSKVASLIRRVDDWRVILQAGTYFVGSAILQLLIMSAEDDRSARTLEVVSDVFLKTIDDKLPTLKLISDRVRIIEDQMSGKSSKEKDKDKGPAVALMTAHGSKGLEWDCVWILGAEEGTFPDESASLQEERRLFYVAMTRARQHLRISAAGTKPLSAFVTEAGVERTPEPPDATEDQMVASPLN